MLWNRLADPPYELKMEADKLLDEWVNSDYDLPFREYLMEHGSERLKDYLQEMSGIKDEG